MRSDADRERIKKLDGIFLPETRSRREHLLASTPDKQIKFIHYTSAESALQILTTKKLWMRSVACMTDFSEALHGFSLLQTYFSKEQNKSRFFSVLEAFAPGATQQAIEKFDYWWTSGIIQHRTFIVSVSEHKEEENKYGRLSMWRAFGGSAARVGIVLKVSEQSKAAEAMNLLFAPVTYRESVDDALNKAIENISTESNFLKTLSQDDLVSWIAHMFLVVVTCTKHPAFEEEREWRAVYNSDIRSSRLISKSIEVIGGLPQVIHSLRLDERHHPVLADLDLAKIFDKIILGPTQYPMTLVEAFASKLSDIKVQDLQGKIIISGIPLRT